MRLVRITLVSSVMLVVGSVPRPAFAAGPLGSDGEAIATSDYAIDLFQGPVLASARTTGLSGAYAALAEGVDGFRTNAAAPGVRDPWSRRWFEFDGSLGITFPNSLSRTDFDNDGRVGFTYSDFYFFTAGLGFQLGTWGFGFAIDAQHYDLEGISGPDGVTRSLELVLQRGHLLGAHSLFDGQLVLGAGLQIASLEFSPSSDEAGDDLAFAISSLGAEAGVLWAPTHLPLRLAFSGRTPSESEPDSENTAEPDEAGDTLVGPFYVPQRLQAPWEIEIGFAVQFGPRPLNVRWRNPHRELLALRHELDQAHEDADTPEGKAEEKKARNRLRTAQREWRAERRAEYAALPRRKLLVSSSLLLSGPVADGVGFESFLRQTIQHSGRLATLTPRLGVEVEPIPHYVQLRGGSYLEPSRFEVGRARLHGTAGFDVRVLKFGFFGLVEKDTAWRIGAYLDGARQYLAWGLSAGIWR